MTGTSSLQKRKGYLIIGGVGLFFAAGYLGMSFQLPFGQREQPGAAVFPLIAGVLLLLGSLATMWEGWKMEQVDQVDFPAGADLKRLLSLIGLLLGYFVALPWLGQLICSMLFCALLMRVLSDRLAWPRIVLYSAGITGALYAVFIYLLKVPMPRGALFA
jgi:putative tricarboxylic transport membrane protein